jgi:hypothetical protein
MTIHSNPGTQCKPVTPARFFLLIVAALFFALSGCDSATDTPEAGDVITGMTTQEEAEKSATPEQPITLFAPDVADLGSAGEFYRPPPCDDCGANATGTIYAALAPDINRFTLNSRGSADVYFESMEVGSYTSIGIQNQAYQYINWPLGHWSECDKLLEQFLIRKYNNESPDYRDDDWIYQRTEVRHAEDWDTRSVLATIGLEKPNYDCLVLRQRSVFDLDRVVGVPSEDDYDSEQTRIYFWPATGWEMRCDEICEWAAEYNRCVSRCETAASGITWYTPN